MGSSFHWVFPHSLVPTKPGPVDSRLYLAPVETPSAGWEWSLPRSGKWENQIRVKQIELQSTGHSQFSYRVLPFLWIKGLPGRTPEGTVCPAHVPGPSLKAAATSLCWTSVRLGRVWINEWLHVGWGKLEHITSSVNTKQWHMPTSLLTLNSSCLTDVCCGVLEGWGRKSGVLVRRKSHKDV